MPSLPRRALSASLLATCVAAVATGCILMPPPLPSAQPLPLPTAAEPAPSAADPAPSPAVSASGELPELLELNTPLEPGTLPGWETSILTDSAFTVEADNDFPIGPTISVREVATQCTFWAYQGAQDGASTDERANTELTLAGVTGTEPGEWEAAELPLEPSASQGVSVVFLSIYDEDPATGDVEAWFARNFLSSETTSTIRGTCPASAGGIDHIDEVVAEHFQVNFLLP
jgi:hypothetical protein